MPGTDASPARPKPVILVIVDGLTPSAFEAADTPALRFLAQHGEYRRAVSTFPSLTPVCLSSIATGSHPDGHHIPHLVWWHRGEQRLVEYGSSFAAIRAAGFAFVPVVGYLEAIAVPLLGLRLRRRAPDKHAGLRSLAKD